MPYKSYLCLAHFHFISIHQLHPPSVDATNAPTQLWMIWSTPYHHMTSLVHRSWSCPLFTVVSVHQRQVLPKLHRLAVHRFEALTCPSPFATGPSSQALSWSSPPWSHDSMSWLICNEILLMWTNPLCISPYNNISPPNVVTQLPKPNKDLSVASGIQRWRCLTASASSYTPSPLRQVKKIQFFALI